MLQQEQGLERQLQGFQTPRRGVEDDRDQDDNRNGGGMMGWVTARASLDMPTGWRAAGRHLLG
jgi:hypothetical protein